MSTIKKTTGLAVLTALALPGAAVSAKGPEQGEQPKGKAKAEQQREKRCTKTVGFSLAGTGLDASKLTLQDGKASGVLTLDVTRANAHAKRFLQITTLPSNDEQPTLTADASKLLLNNVNGLSDVAATDRVKVHGKVTKPRRGCESTTPTLDVRNVTISRATEQSSESESTTEKEND